MNSKSRPGASRAGDAYRRAGVDIDAGEALVAALKPLAAATRRPGSAAVLGGFGGVFDLRAAGFKDPLLIAANDGVGTKLAVAAAMRRHETIGIDLVAMCVNDVIAQGGEPLLFLDYFATSRLDAAVAETVIAGIAQGCKQAKCALAGGETAEMPGMYRDGDYDLAGFALGACERADLLPRNNIQAGDMVFGLASAGFHANGFSLLRHILQEQNLGFDAPFPADKSKTIGEVLLRPTRIYAAALHGLTGRIKALAHITGGGLPGNIPRILPDGLSAQINAGAWPMPAEMVYFQSLGNLDDQEMARTFNCGIGMAGIVAAAEKQKLFTCLQKRRAIVYDIGQVVESAPGQTRVQLLGEWNRGA